MEGGSPRTYNEPADQLSFWEATAELVSAGQEVVLDRVELLRTEITHDVQQVVVGVGMVTAGALIGIFGWVLAMGALVVLLSRPLTLDAAMLLVGLPHLAGGVALAVLAVQRFRNLETVNPGAPSEGMPRTEEEHRG